MISYQLSNIAVTINGSETNTTDATKLTLTATAVDRVHIVTGRDAPLAHQSAGSITLTVVHPDPLAIALSHTVEITATIADTRVGIAYGWITQWTSDRLRNGAYRYEIKCADAIGRAAGLYYGSQPRPTETISARLAAIDQAHGAGSIIDINPAINATCMPVDVDNRSVLDVVQDTAPLGYLVTTAANPAKITIQSAPAATLVFPRISDGPDAPMTLTGRPSVLNLRADQVENVPRHLDRTSVVSYIRYTYRVVDGTRQTIQYTSPHTRDGSTIDVTSDTSTVLDLDGWSARIFGATRDGVPQLEHAATLVNLTPEQIRTIIGPTARGPLIVVINDAPPDVIADQMITALDLTIHRGKLTITATLAPLACLGISPLSWRVIPTITGQSWQSYRWPAASTIRYRDTYYLTNGGI